MQALVSTVVLVGGWFALLTTEEVFPLARLVGFRRTKPEPQNRYLTDARENESVWSFGLELEDLHEQ